jgi:hypothetical protein
LAYLNLNVHWKLLTHCVRGWGLNLPTLHGYLKVKRNLCHSSMTFTSGAEEVTPYSRLSHGTVTFIHIGTEAKKEIEGKKSWHCNLYIWSGDGTPKLKGASYDILIFTSGAQEMMYPNS